MLLRLLRSPLLWMNEYQLVTHKFWYIRVVDAKKKPCRVCTVRNVAREFKAMYEPKFFNVLCVSFPERTFPNHLLWNLGEWCERVPHKEMKIIYLKFSQSLYGIRICGLFYMVYHVHLRKLVVAIKMTRFINLKLKMNIQCCICCHFDHSLSIFHHHKWNRKPNIECS